MKKFSFRLLSFALGVAIMRKSSLLCQSLDEKLEESLSDRFMDVLAALESLEAKSREDKDHILGLVSVLPVDNVLCV